MSKETVDRAWHGGLNRYMDEDKWADGYSKFMDSVRERIEDLLSFIPPYDPLEENPISASVGHISRHLTTSEQRVLMDVIHSMNGDNWIVEQKGIGTRIRRGETRRYLDTEVFNSHLFDKPASKDYADYK